MSYIATYINPLVQFGTVTLDLILQDSDGIMPYKRISKKFHEPEQVEEEALIAEAIMEINRAVREFKNNG